MRPELAAVAAELALWRDQGLVLPLWWRDDDAVAPSLELDRLIALAADVAAPLHLAVIPDPATSELADRLRGEATISVLQHGWRHANHAPYGQKKAEFGAHRPAIEMLGEIAQGWLRIQSLYGAQALPLFTPPWNRIAPQVVAGLADAGLAGLTTFKPRLGRFAAPGLAQVNTHLDPIDWRNGGSLLPPALLAEQLSIELADRRTGRTDRTEPYGLLTHHLVHDEAVWAFMADLLGLLDTSGVTRWTAPL